MRWQVRAARFTDHKRDHGMQPKDLNIREFRTGSGGFSGFRRGYPKASGRQICAT